MYQAVHTIIKAVKSLGECYHITRTSTMIMQIRVRSKWINMKCDCANWSVTQSLFPFSCLSLCIVWSVIPVKRYSFARWCCLYRLEWTEWGKKKVSYLIGMVAWRGENKMGNYISPYMKQGVPQIGRGLIGRWSAPKSPKCRRSVLGLTCLRKRSAK